MPLPKLFQIAVIASLGFSASANGQRNGGSPKHIPTSQLLIGEEGVIWHSTWELALQEAKRSQRPIFFMAAACQRQSVSGVF